MANLLKIIGRLLTRDLSGRTWQREATHPYFMNLVYFGSRESSDCYWEAQIELPGTEAFASVTMAGTPDGPTKAEEQFCRFTAANLDALFEQCRASFEAEFVKWVESPMPAEWRQAFKLDGFQVPPEGNPSNPWQACFFVEPAGHYFTACLEQGKVTEVVVDG